MLQSVNPETKASSHKSNNSWTSPNLINTRKYSVLHSKHLSSPSGRLIASEQELQLANDWLYYITYYALNENTSPPQPLATQIKPPPTNIITRKDQPRKSRTEIEDFHFKDAVNTYQQLEKEEIMCKNCQQQSKKVNSFGYHDGFICMNCAAKAYSRISELVDWEEIVENGKGIQCDRLRHQKKLSSFIKFENKTGTYKRVKLCIFCRNVKRWEYSRKSLYPSKNPHSPTTTTIITNPSNNNNINSSSSSLPNNINKNTNIISPKRRKIDELIPILPRPFEYDNPNNNNIPIPISQPPPIKMPHNSIPNNPTPTIIQPPLPLHQSLVLSNIIQNKQQQQLQQQQQQQQIQQLQQQEVPEPTTTTTTIPIPLTTTTITTTSLPIPTITQTCVEPQQQQQQPLINDDNK